MRLVVKLQSTDSYGMPARVTHNHVKEFCCRDGDLFIYHEGYEEKYKDGEWIALVVDKASP